MNITGISNYIKKRTNITALFLCLAGVALNMLLSYIVSFFKLPLYLDTVGTVTVAVIGGYLPGVIVGFVTNIIKSIGDPSALYYGVLNVLIAFAASFFAGKGMHKKIGGIIGMILTFTVIGGGFGAIIPWFMDGISFDSESLSGLLYRTGYFNQGMSHLLSSIILDFPDKVITVLVSLGLVYIIPDRLYPFFRLSLRVQNSQSEDISVGEKPKTRKRSLRIKMLFVLVFSLVTVAVVCAVLSVNVFKKMTVNEHTNLARGTAKLASGVVDGDRIDEYLKSHGNTQNYKETKERLENILFSSEEIAFLYIYKPEPEGFRCIIDIDTDKAKAESIGKMIPYDEGFEPYIPQLLAGEEIDPIMTNDRYGYLLTVAVPVFNSSGNCTCYAIADVDMMRLRDTGISFLTEIASVFLGFFILLCVFIIWFTDNRLIKPINAIVKCMDNIAHSSNTQESVDEDVRAFRSLGICTGDEIETLYLSVENMTKNHAEQMRSIRRLSDSTAKMQDGLIITMADLVESRDSDTGAHVQKTAAYVKIIVEGLNKKGYYPGKITPKFMSDVVRSAPLHDIGKINIPDGVLNKPGKLTDEEYEIMKTHTTAGKRIMENAISTVEGDSYLKEARNMAAYHHERWDGKGYPEGIHGEVIPLSARIMAVADVFDALTSKRVYKPAFPLEKALEILEEGKGKQFDPKCIEVFMESLPEVKVILKKYNKDE